jgi:hypothetical protein
MTHSNRGTDRREFLTRCPAAAASGLLWSGMSAADDQAPAPLPTIALGPHRVTRLVVGANPLSGYSYLGHDMDQEMKSYFTPEHTMAFLRQCEREGINTHQFSPASKATEVYRALREQGSKLQLIGLLSKPEDIKPTAQSLQPIALVHHGGVTDQRFREGRAGQVRDFVKAVKDLGILAGVSAHNPDCIQRMADEGWENDFFMTCFYHVTREKPPAEPAPVLDGPTAPYTFYKNDPLAMCAVIRQVKKPCLAFKILGAGRHCASQEAVREAFEFAFKNIKPGDGVIVGMYPRRFDQVRANAQYVRNLIATA